MELDQVGVCWDGDLVRTLDGSGWQARAFRGAGWTVLKGAEALSNRVNAYRVLLTRVRQAQVIWVPRGDADDPTRAPGRYDAVAAYLAACGLQPLDEAAGKPKDAGVTDSVLL